MCVCVSQAVCIVCLLLSVVCVLFVVVVVYMHSE